MSIHHRKLFPPFGPPFDCPDADRPPPRPRRGTPGPTLFKPPAGTHDHTSVPILMFSVVGFLLLFLLGYLFYISKCHSSLNSSSERRNTPGFEDYYYGGEIRGLGPDNSGRQVSTAGLEQSVIDSIPFFEFRSTDRLVEAAECSVCLNEFEEDQVLRLLPKCCHAFHKPCIDEWLRSHQNCPLCRAPIVLENTPLNAAEQGSNGPAAREELETESLENNGGTRGCRVGEIEEERKDLQRSSKRKRQVRVLSDLAGRLTKQEQELQPVRRSISMDASSAASASRTQPVMASIPPARLEGCSSSQ